MNTAPDSSDEMRPEYDFSGGIRGLFHERYKQGTRVTLVEPDVARVFPDSTSVNKALRILIKLDADGLLNLNDSLKEG